MGQEGSVPWHRPCGFHHLRLVAWSACSSGCIMSARSLGSSSELSQEYGFLWQASFSPPLCYWKPSEWPEASQRGCICQHMGSGLAQGSGTTPQGCWNGFARYKLSAVQRKQTPLPLWDPPPPYWEWWIRCRLILGSQGCMSASAGLSCPGEFLFLDKPHLKDLKFLCKTETLLWTQ